MNKPEADTEEELRERVTLDAADVVKHVIHSITTMLTNAGPEEVYAFASCTLPIMKALSRREYGVLILHPSEGESEERAFSIKSLSLSMEDAREMLEEAIEVLSDMPSDPTPASYLH